MEKRIESNLTELVFIIDRSGSMGGLEDDTVGGFNSMLEKQKNQEGDCFVTTVLFDHQSEIIHDRLPVSEVPPLDTDTYFVRGTTALMDAVGETIKHIETVHRYARTEDVPKNTLFVITTDGMENASRKYSSKEVKKLIKEKTEKLGWEFLFLGANIDAHEAAESIGIKKERAANYRSDSKGTRLNYSVLGKTISKMRQCCSLPSDWAEEIEADMKSDR